MNNASVIFQEDDSQELHVIPLLRERATALTEIIEALEHIAGSSYWKVLQQHIFDVDLEKAKRRLALENDTTEIFRLQGEVRFREKLSLETLIQKHRNELTTIRKKIV